MSWNDVVSSVRDKIRQTLGRSAGPKGRMTRRDSRLEQIGGAPLATPAVDVYENDKEILIHADVPGGTRQGATVAWDESRCLKFLVKSEEQLDGSPWIVEYQRSDWYRTLSLPEYADGARASSTIKNGVLTIRIPKRTSTARLITVKAE